jgi:hypothetical protein
MRLLSACLVMDAVLALGSPATPASAAGKAYTIRPAAAWIVTARPSVATSAPAAGDSTGTHYLLFDQQIRVGPGGREDYRRSIWRLETTASLQDASEVRISFDPAFERLVIHDVRVTRDGARVWEFRTSDVRVIEAEEDIDERLYNGELTAVVFLKDLRVGDTVDYSFTIEGQNPVLGGRFDGVLDLGFGVPVDVVRRILLWQKGAAPRIKVKDAPEPAASTGPGGTRYSWEIRDSHPPPLEDAAPTWYRPYPRAEVSEFADWQDVARHCRALFASVERPSAATAALVRGWGLQDASEEARVERAVRFVQDDVRYLGMEMGPHSHQPHAPADTLRRRFGDCKDKATLLVALLRELGVRAWPALVATRTGRTLSERLPSMFAFDHVIVAIPTAGQLTFVDATASQEGGRLRDRPAPAYSYALVLSEASPGLTALAAPKLEAPSTEVEETFALPSWDAPARLEVVSTYRGDAADDMRRRRARATSDEITRRYRDFYTREYGELRPLTGLSTHDDRHANVLVVRESYELPTLWKDGEGEFRAWLVDSRLQRPQTLVRSTPLAIEHPENVRQVLTIRLPAPPELDPGDEAVRGSAFTLEKRTTIQGNDARLVYSYHSERGSLEPKEVAAYVHALDRASDLVRFRVGARRPGLAASAAGTVSRREVLAGRIVVALVLLGVVGLVLWRTRWGGASSRTRQWRAALQKAAPLAPGGAPLSAIAVGAGDVIPAAGVGGVCGCRGAWREIERAAVVYEARPMTVVTRRCDECGGERTLYFRIG